MSPGGVESLLMNLYRNIDREKIQFDFYVNDKGVFDDEIRQMGGTIYYTDSNIKYGFFKYMRNWDKFLKDNCDVFDAVHCHYNNVSLYMLKIAKKNKIKIRICHSHASETLGNPILKLFRLYFNHIAISNSTMLLGCSEKANEWLYGKHDASEAKLLNNGVEVEKFKYSSDVRKKIRDELNLSDNDFVLGHVGRLVEVKNHKYLLKVFKEFHKENNNSYLIIIGEGDLENSLKNLAKEMNLEKNILFLGMKKNVEDYMNCFDSFVFPSFNEGLPVTLIEAQASGLQVLASSNITKMCSILDSFEFLDIDDEPINWAKRIKKSDNRLEAYEILKESEFNIKKTCKEYAEIIEEAVKI